KGVFYLLHRDRPGKNRFKTPTATAATRGTEFTLEVEEATGRTILTVLEGEAELGNAAGSIRLASGEQGIAALGQAPVKTADIDTRADAHPPSRLAEALRRVIAAVKGRPYSSPFVTRPSPALATEWLAESYYQQSLSQLPDALGQARLAVQQSPQFAFGWVRV